LAKAWSREEDNKKDGDQHMASTKKRKEIVPGMKGLTDIKRRDQSSNTDATQSQKEEKVNRKHLDQHEE